MTAYRNAQIHLPNQKRLIKRLKDKKLIQNVRKEFKRFVNSSYLIKDETFFHILQCKMQGKPARAFFVAYLASYLQKVDPTSEKKYNQHRVFFQKELPFILEAIISIQYYHNQILDGKAGVTTPAAINDNLIKGNLLKDQLYHYIEGLEINAEDKLKLTRTVRSIFEHVDVGQYIEKHCNTYQAYQSRDFNPPFTSFMQEKIESDQAMIDTLQKIENIITAHIPMLGANLSFLQLYLRRIYLTNTSLYKLIAEFITDFLGILSETREDIIKFSITFGITQQLVNDNIDFVPSYCHQSTKSKTEFDAFSDLKNKNITLPILIHIVKNSQGEIINFLKCNTLFIDERIFLNRSLEKKFFNEITDNYSIYFSMTIGKKIKEISESYLRINNSSKNVLADMLQIAENNRFYKYFYNKPAYKVYKRNKYKVKTVVPSWIMQLDSIITPNPNYLCQTALI